jgi:RNA polymerase sigma-70 factor (ECF subfamily)
MRVGCELFDRVDREILTLTLFEGLKPGEIARRVGLSPEAVRTRKSRAVQRVIEELRSRGVSRVQG